MTSGGITGGGGPNRAEGAGSRSSPAAARKPLFLGQRVRARVEEDGPALLVRAAGRPQTRYPLGRISRVIASPRVDWSAGALRACLEYGIPIVIVADDGAPLGSVHPAQTRTPRLSESIEELLDRPDWRQLYDTWLRASRMRVLADWRERRRLAGTPVTSSEYDELARTYVYGTKPPSTFFGATGLWRGALWALALEAILRRGLRPVYWGSGGDALNLLEDVARLMELRLRLEVHMGMQEALEGEATVVCVFHALSTTLELQAGRAIASMARWLAQVLGEWR